jgi:hypothetical protein
MNNPPRLLRTRVSLGELGEFHTNTDSMHLEGRLEPPVMSIQSASAYRLDNEVTNRGI